MYRITTLVLSILLMVLLLTVGPGQALAVSQGNQGLQDGWAIDDNEGKVLFTDAVAAKMAEAGAGWVRINFRLGGFRDWTETDTFGYSALDLYDQVVANASNNNLKVLGLLSNESWRGDQSEWQANSAERDGGNGDNEYLRNVSLNAAVILAEHFAGRVDLWEVWNEPNAYTTYSDEEGYIGSSFIYPSNFAWLLRHVYEDVKTAEISGERFVSGGVFGHDLGGLATIVEGRPVIKRGDPMRPGYGVRLERDSKRSSAASSVSESGSDYLRATYDQGKANAGWEDLKATYGSYPLDGIGQHLYIDQGGATSAEKIGTYLRDVRDAYTAYEDEKTAKQTLVTEVGWATDRVSKRTQADNLKTAYGEFKETTYLQTAYWFQLRDIPPADLYYGLLTPFDEPWKEKHSWKAYQTYAVFGGDNAPSVTITNPQDGDTVSGAVTVIADASDDNGVTQVEFFVDESSIGIDSNGSDGWATSWDTTSVDDGFRTVTATATDTAGQTASDSISVTVDNVNDPPVASFAYSCSGLTCDFDGSGSSDPDGTIVSYDWDFGDETTGSGVTVSHTYAEEGTYTVVLTVTDDDGANDPDSQDVTVSEGSDTMHVSAIDMRYAKRGLNYFVYTSVTIVDESNNPVSEATVYLTTTLPHGSTVSDSGIAGSDGTMTFSVKSQQTGTYTSEVTDVIHSSLTYDSAANLDTSESLTVPQTDTPDYYTLQ